MKKMIAAALLALAATEAARAASRAWSEAGKPLNRSPW